MSRRTGAHGPHRYEFRVVGHLGPHWSTWFGRLTLTLEDDGTTALRGPVADQAELHGLLTKVRDLGATLVSLTLLDISDTADSQEQQPSLAEDSPAAALGGVPPQHPPTSQPSTSATEQE